MRPFPALTVLLVSLAIVPGALGVLRYVPGGSSSSGGVATGSSETAFVLTGSGNGHGVGLSQYGALAQARAGRAAADILSFYFPGTELGRRTGLKLRVLLLAAAKSVTLTSAAPIAVRDAAGVAHELSAGETVVGPELQLPLDGVPSAVPGPLTLTPSPGALISVGNRAYRGTIEITSNGSALQVVNTVGLEAYVQGVVPGEMPSTWPGAALETQAIAARSFALATLVKGKTWDVYPDGRSQQYRGAGAETPSTTAAIRATTGKVLLYRGLVATTFYSSSSGGHTQSAFDAFGLDLSYLPAQDDPWDESSPFHVWKPRALTGRQLGNALGLSAPVVDIQGRFSATGRAITLTATGADGTSIEVAGAEARRRLGLRSTAFRLATLRFLTPPAATSAGAAVRLTGVARDAQTPLLEVLAPDGIWKPLGRRLRVTATGTFAVVVHPVQTTTYRLSASGLAGPSLTIPVVGAQP